MAEWIEGIGLHYQPGIRIIENIDADSDLDEDDIIEPSDLSYVSVRKLYHCLEQDDVYNLEKSFHEYLYNPDIYNFMMFHTSKYDSYYPLCTCVKYKKQPIRELKEKVPCNCINGKRYLAFLYAYLCSTNINCKGFCDKITIDSYYKGKCARNNREFTPIVLSDCAQYILDSGEMYLDYESSPKENTVSYEIQKEYFITNFHVEPDQTETAK
jgi:hypothetical protein